MREYKELAASTSTGLLAHRTAPFNNIRNNVALTGADVNGALTKPPDGSTFYHAYQIP